MCLPDSLAAHRSQAAEPDRGPSLQATARRTARHPVPVLIGGLLLGAVVARLIKATGSHAPGVVP